MYTTIYSSLAFEWYATIDSLQSVVSRVCPSPMSGGHGVYYMDFFQATTLDVTQSIYT